MLYLIYLRNGFIKKFPLDKDEILLGRAISCDLSIEESFISKEHAKLTLKENSIAIHDMGSTNGVFTEEGETRNTQITLNQWFRIGHLKFFLKKGNPAEFEISDKIQPLFKGIYSNIESKGYKTNTALNILYAESLVEMLQIGFSLDKCGNLFEFADKILQTTLKKGCLLLVSKADKSWRIESQWNYTDQYKAAFKAITQHKSLLKEDYENIPIAKIHFSSFFLKDQDMVLIYILETPLKGEIIAFLKTLSIEVSVIQSLIQQGSPDKDKNNTTKAPEIITTNSTMLNLLSKCKKIAKSNLFALIEGETGTGKELFARFIHYHSKRSHGEFVALNCAAIPENLMEVELFGHEKGAFTDASIQRKGKLELASGGTLVLDEIGDMPLNLQVKLLRTIQEEQFYRIGSNRPIKVDLRIICMTNQNIKEMMQKKTFREDLYYRIAHVSLKIPPVRERKEDIIPLLDHFTALAAKDTGIFIKGFSDKAVKAMETYDWPGNVREFENEMYKIISLSESNDIVGVDVLKEEINEFFKSIIIMPDTGKSEKTKLLMLLKRHKWNKSLVAKELNFSRTTLYEKLKKYGIN
ncbi:MAG: sigma 54-dependent Fis family transcriptional regulator [bacterium]|nr:sigma 54-dependent Fis family transcriptional regulator [bacterium]